MRFHSSNFTARAAGLLFTGLALVACDPKILLGEFGDSDPQQSSGDSQGSGASQGSGDSQGSSASQGSGDSQGSGGTEGQSSGGTEGQSSGGGDTGGGSSESGTGDPETSSSSSGGDTGDPACDPWLQDCPSGQKCAPYWTGADGPQWDAFHCVDLDPTPQSVGSSCEVTGGYHSGEDDCELGALCWDVDPVSFEGHCIALCEGSPQSPSCDSGFHCADLNNGDFNICLPDCDPLAQDCATGEECIPLPGDPDTFLCVLDAGGAEGQAFDPCEFVNACDPGLHCASPELASECSQMALGCCIPFCDLDETNTCPGVDQVCLPWYAPNEAPSGDEDVGFCGLEP